MTDWIFDAHHLGGANRHQLGGLRFPHILVVSGPPPNHTVESPATGGRFVVNIASRNVRNMQLNPRQTSVLRAILHLTGNALQPTTYQAVRRHLGENPDFCRGIGATCRAIYRRGWTDIHNLVLKK